MYKHLQDCLFICKDFVIVLSGEDDIRKKMVAMLSPSVYTQLLDFQLINNRVTLHVSKVSLGGEDWRWVLMGDLSQYYIKGCTVQSNILTKLHDCIDKILKEIG